MRTPYLIALSLTAALLVGCGNDGDQPTAKPIAVHDMNADQKAQYKRGQAARDALAQRLMGRLMQAVQKDGPVGAVAVCKEAAPAIAAEVGAEQGLSIGRTSFKLRNPTNEVPGWARRSVKDRVAATTWFALSDGGLAGLMPIRIMPLCTTCHGAPDTLDEDLRAALATHYPDDRATGFAVGDLRGWFWVEVPAGP